MRADPAAYGFVSPPSLQVAVQLLAEANNGWLPIAGGTDVMVRYAAGALLERKLLNIWNLPELRRIDVLQKELQIGAGCTYSDLRQHAIVVDEFPLLSLAASWTGGIANQNRGTLGGNIVNASPAADSLPALLAYEAELILVSARGERRVTYNQFHTGYKQMDLRSDELVRAICLSRKFAGFTQYARKVGARKAQAISKVCIAGLGKVHENKAEQVRIAVGSLAPCPIRLLETERAINGQNISPDLVARARMIARAEIQPIDDIRSTARYRAAVVGNLVGEFLETLRRAHS